MSAGWKPGEAAREIAISAAEIDLGVTLPSDYRAFLTEAGGSIAGDRWRGLWTVAEVVSLNRHMPVFRWFKGLVGIGNEGFLVYAIDFREPGPPPVVSVGLSSSDPEDIQREANSFLEWLEETLPKK